LNELGVPPLGGFGRTPVPGRLKAELPTLNRV